MDLTQLDLSQVYAVEYSIEQDAFHVDPLAHILKINAEMVRSRSSNDYKLLALAGSREEAHAIARKVRALMEAEKNTQATDAIEPE